MADLLGYGAGCRPDCRHSTPLLARLEVPYTYPDVDADPGARTR